MSKRPMHGSAWLEMSRRIQPYADIDPNPGWWWQVGLVLGIYALMCALGG